MNSVNNANILPLTGHDSASETNADQHVYVQLRPASAAAFRKCLSHLQAIATRHPEANTTMAGLAQEDHQFVLTVDINLGLRHEITIPSTAAVAGYQIVSEMFTTLFDYLPRYSAAPTPQERDMATTVATALTAEGSHALTAAL